MSESQEATGTLRKQEEEETLCKEDPAVPANTPGASTFCINLPETSLGTGVCPGETGQHGAVAAEIVRWSRIICIMVKNGNWLPTDSTVGNQKPSGCAETMAWGLALGPEFRSPDTHINARQM